MPNWHPHELDFITTHYGRGTTPFQMCPPPLFSEIAKINSLRGARHAAAVVAPHDNQPQLINEEAPVAILQRIHTFSPSHWAASKPAANDDWRLVGRIYQAAAAIYYTRSLPPSPASSFPTTQTASHNTTTQQALLHELLGTALANNRIQRFLLWPLVVHGVEACRGDGRRTRTFVQEQLCEMSRQVGSYAPLAAKGVLERFWASGETDWDACFERPCLFLNQFAVDMIGISPEP
jgi:hypothetical protein